MAENFIEWDDRLSIGIPMIDKQHQQLIAITNNLYNACRQGGETIDTNFIAALHETVNYIDYHFGIEDKIMQRIKYPEYALHKKEHDEFAREVLKEIKEYESDRIYAPYAMVRYLRDWILSHIAITDLKLGTYLLNMKKTGALEKIIEAKE
jgi:hemerythrin